MELKQQNLLALLAKRLPAFWEQFHLVFYWLLLEASFGAKWSPSRPQRVLMLDSHGR